MSTWHSFNYLHHHTDSISSLQTLDHPINRHKRLILHRSRNLIHASLDSLDKFIMIRMSKELYMSAVAPFYTLAWIYEDLRQWNTELRISRRLW